MTRLLFISTKNRWFFRLTLLGTLLAFTLILFSAYARMLGTTSACSDWPLCNGHWLVAQPQTSLAAARVWLATMERYIIFTNTLIILLMTITAASLQRQLGFRPFLICLALLGCGVAQILLTSLSSTPPTQELLTVGGFLLELTSLSLFWWTSQISRPNSYSHSHPSLKFIRPWAWLGLLFIVLQIVFGGWLTFTEAGCHTFPYCSIHLTPSVEWRQVLHLPQKTVKPEVKEQLHLFHRLGSLFGFAYLIAFSFLLLFNRFIYPTAFFIFILLAAQISLGISNLTWLQSMFLILTQNVIVTLLLLGIVSLLISLYNKPQDFWYG